MPWCTTVAVSTADIHSWYALAILCLTPSFLSRRKWSINLSCAAGRAPSGDVADAVAVLEPAVAVVAAADVAAAWL
eukprot:2868431-Pyramimonas_sp.AAC.1